MMRLSVSLSPDLVRYVKDTAKRRNVTQSAVVVEALRRMRVVEDAEDRALARDEALTS